MRRSERIHLCLVAVALFGMLLLALGVAGALWVGKEKWWLTAAGFFLAVILGCLCDHDGFSKILRRCPKGLSGTRPWLARCRRLSIALMAVAFATMMASLLVLIAFARYDGLMESYPILATREVYRLKTDVAVPVSRLRYVLVGISFEVGICSLLTCCHLFPLHYLLFGEWPVQEWNREESRR